MLFRNTNEKAVKIEVWNIKDGIFMYLGAIVHLIKSIKDFKQAGLSVDVLLKYYD